MNNNRIYCELKKILGKNITLNEPMSKHTSFKIGGNADFFVKAFSIEEVYLIQKYCQEKSIPLHVIGNGSNLLVSDKGVRGIVLKINIETIKFEEKSENVILTVGAGAKIGAIAQMLLKNSISGMEEISGIPGTIGGAIKMNAGAYGKEMKDLVVLTKCLNEKGEIIELTNEEQKFDYRTSIFKKEKYIILETKLKLQKKNKEEIKYKMEECKGKRTSSQPVEYPSAGSTFKRGNGFITAKIIDECGLKGYMIGRSTSFGKTCGLYNK